MTRKVMNGLDLQAQRIINLGDPSSAQDAVTKSYADNLILGAKWKNSVIAATTGNITNIASPGFTTLDGVTLTSGTSRILVKDQTAASGNGIYLYNGSSSPLTRTPDADSAAELNGAAVYVEQGSTNADKAYTETATITTLGTDSVTWAQLSGGSSYTADGQGIELVGSQFQIEIDPTNPGLSKSSSGIKANAGTGIAISGSNITIDTAVVTRKISVACAAATTTTVTHGWGTRDVQVVVYSNATPWEDVICDVTRPNANDVVVTFAVAPAAGDYRIVVQG